MGMGCAGRVAEEGGDRGTHRVTLQEHFNDLPSSCKTLLAQHCPVLHQHPGDPAQTSSCSWSEPTRTPGREGEQFDIAPVTPLQAPEGTEPTGLHRQAAHRRVVAMVFAERAALRPGELTGDAAEVSWGTELVFVACSVSLPFSSSTAAFSTSSISIWLLATISSLVTATKDGSRARATRPPEIRACSRGWRHSPMCAHSVEVSLAAGSLPSPPPPCCPLH